MNVPAERTAAQRVPLPPWEPAARSPPLVTTGPAEPASTTAGTQCWHLCLPIPTLLLVMWSAAYSRPAGHGWQRRHCDGSCPCGCSIALPHLPSLHGHCAGLCTHSLTRLMKWATCSGHAMPAPIVTVTPSHGHVVPLRPCWKQERGTRVLGNERNLKNKPPIWLTC